MQKKGIKSRKKQSYTLQPQSVKHPHYELLTMISTYILPNKKQKRAKLMGPTISFELHCSKLLSCFFNPTELFLFERLSNLPTDCRDKSVRLPEIKKQIFYKKQYKI